jgi:hypothetical protein
MLEPFEDVEFNCFKLETLESAASRGRDIDLSTSSGPAPVYVVETMTYG